MNDIAPFEVGCLGGRVIGSGVSKKSYNLFSIEEMVKLYMLKLWTVICVFLLSLYRLLPNFFREEMS